VNTKYELQLIEHNKNDELVIMKSIILDFIKILEHSSFVLIGKKRYWELLRGVYNDNFNKTRI
jgi:hypothetical protein